MAAVSIVSSLYIFILMTVIYLRRAGRSYWGWLAAMLGCVLAAHLFSTGFYLVADADLATLLFGARMFGTNLLPVFFFMSVLCITGQQSQCKGLTVALLSLVPLLTAVMAVTNPYHSLFYLSQVLLDSPVRELSYQPGLFFHLQMIYNTALMGYTVFYSVIAFRRAPLRLVRKNTMILVASIIPVVVGMSVMLQAVRLPYDLTLLASLVSVSLLIYAEYSRGGAAYLFTRDLVFDGLDSPILIVGVDGRIEDINHSARDLDPDTDFDGPVSPLFDSWLADWIARRGYATSNEGGAVYLSRDEQVLKLLKTPILNRQGQSIGNYVELANRTEEQLLARRMERLARTDSLTGLLNRAEYDATLIRLDGDVSLPVGVLMIDINGLKRVNDSYGHKMGDRLIQSVADILREALPSQTLLFRIGGDEFVALIPEADNATLAEYVEQIRQAAAAAPKVGGEVSVAVGAAMRDDGESTVTRIVTLADRGMYEVKQEYYAAEGRNRRKRSTT